MPGTGTILLRGPRVREALKHFGRAAGLPGSHAKPYVSHSAKKGRGARWAYVHYKQINILLMTDKRIDKYIFNVKDRIG